MDDPLTPLVDQIQRSSRLLCSLTTLALGLLLWESPCHHLSLHWTSEVITWGHQFFHQGDPSELQSPNDDLLSIAEVQSLQAYLSALLPLSGWILGSLIPVCSLPTAAALLCISLILWPVLALWAGNFYGIDIHWLLPAFQSIWVLLWIVCQHALISRIRSEWQTLEISRQVSKKLLGRGAAREQWWNAPPGKEYLTLVQGEFRSLPPPKGFTSVANFMAMGKALDRLECCVLDHHGILLPRQPAGWQACWREPNSALQAIQAIQAWTEIHSTGGNSVLIHGGEWVSGNWKPRNYFCFGVMGEGLLEMKCLSHIRDLLQVRWLITSDVQGLPTKLLRTRRLGWFQCSESSKPIELLEILGWVDPHDFQPPGWTRLFEEGLLCFASQDWDEAESKWRQCMMNRRLAEEHAGRAPEDLQDDGPCLFYLEQVLPQVRTRQLPPGWSGILEVFSLNLSLSHHLKKSSAAQSA